ncbi:MAG: acetamidase/formamidase family protein [Bacteroidota bacterium]
MRSLLLSLLVLLCPSVALSQSSSAEAAAGDWTFYMDGDPTPQRVQLVADGDSVRGRVYGRAFASAVERGAISFQVGSYAWSGTIDGDQIAGDIVTSRRTRTWSAQRYRPPATPRAFSHEPAAYYRLLSSDAEPALRIFAGDTVRTTSVDGAGWSTGGYREQGNRVTEGGNPLTGPFYVEGTLPGDILAVHLLQVRLNRDWAFSGDALQSNVLDPAYLRDREVEGNLIQWTLDTERGVARLQEPTPALADYEVPLTPFLGSVAVAPGGGQRLSSRDAGSWGGNMEFIEVREGATVYLPVGAEGAYLYLGDGHAVQGDGELTGDALETTMAITFTVDVLRYRFRTVPRVETEAYLSSLGIAGSLDQAITRATSDMARWLESEYGLSSTETALVMGTAVQYDVPDMVPPKFSIAIRVDRATLDRIRGVESR